MSFLFTQRNVRVHGNDAERERGRGREREKVKVLIKCDEDFSIVTSSSNE